MSSVMTWIDGKQYAVTSYPPVPPPPAPSPGANEPVIPATAKVIDLLPAVTPWKENHDAGTPGSASGTTVYPFTAPDGSTVRQFQFTDTGKGGEIYHVHVLDDATPYTHFCYETVEASPDWSNIECAEKDLEKVDAHGNVLDMATQMSGYSGTEEVTGAGKWQPTGVKRDPSKLAPNVLHTTRNYVTANADGSVNYDGQFFDGTYTPIGVTLQDTKANGWTANILNLQLQYDGKSSGSVQSTIFMHVLRVHCW